MVVRLELLARAAQVVVLVREMALEPQEPALLDKEMLVEMELLVGIILFERVAAEEEPVGLDKIHLVALAVMVV